MREMKLVCRPLFTAHHRLMSRNNWMASFHDLVGYKNQGPCNPVFADSDSTGNFHFLWQGTGSGSPGLLQRPSTLSDIHNSTNYRKASYAPVERLLSCRIYSQSQFRQSYYTKLETLASTMRGFAVGTLVLLAYWTV
jgi:hypothetical protein